MKIAMLATTAFVGFLTPPAFATDLPSTKTELVLPMLAGTPIYYANNQVSVDFLNEWLSYAERAYYATNLTPAGGKLDSENGSLPGYNVSVSLMRNWIVDNLYMNAQVSYVSGDATFDGSTCVFGGTCTPVSRTNSATIFDTDFRLGKGFGLAPNVMLTPYFGIGTNYWLRRGQYSETYTNDYAGGGLLAQYAPTDKLVLSAYGLVGGTFGSHISVGTAGPKSPAWSGPLGDSGIYKLGLSADYALTRNIHLHAGVDYVDFRYGHSAVQPVTGQVEPNSTTSDVMLKVGVGYTFGDFASTAPVVAKY